jgi:UTP--glucose-1-phosphate uridylyltransferase
VYAYNFEGRRYDVGDKQGYLEATIEFALKRPDLRDDFLRYLIKTVGPLVAGKNGNAGCK